MNYELNIYKQTVELVPPDKRLSTFLHWLWTQLSPLNWLNNALFKVYKIGETYSDWTAGTYAKGDRVRYNKAVYESFVASNTDEPTTTDTWIKVSDNFIGLDDRVQFCSARILYEYALNTWFNTDANPCVWSNIPGASTIYITDNAIITGFFRVGADETTSSYVGLEVSSEPVDGDGAEVVQYAFTIWVEASVYAALGADNDIRNATIRNFADKYCPAGLFYEIDTY